jgi:hypothetical protein
MTAWSASVRRGNWRPYLPRKRWWLAALSGGDAEHGHAGGLEAGQVLVELAGLLGAHSVVVSIDR